MQTCQNFSFFHSILKNITISQNLIVSERSFLIFSGLYFKNITSLFDSILSSFSDTYLFTKIKTQDCFPIFSRNTNTSTLILNSSFHFNKIKWNNLGMNSLFIAQSNPPFYVIKNSTFSSLISQMNGGVKQFINYFFI